MNLSELGARYEDLSGYVDVEDGLNRLRRNKKIYAGLLNSFAQNTYVDELREQLEKGDIDGAEKTAHIIKGVAANLSLPLAYELSSRIDARLKAGDADAPIGELSRVMDQTVEYIPVVIRNLDDID